MLNKGKPAPDEVAQRALDEVKRLRDENAQRQVTEARAASERAFLEEIGSDSYENIAVEWPNRSDAMNEARAELQRFAAKGGDPNTITYKQLGKYLDKLAAYRAEQREATKAARKAKATPQGDTRRQTAKAAPAQAVARRGNPRRRRSATGYQAARRSVQSARRAAHRRTRKLSRTSSNRRSSDC